MAFSHLNSINLVIGIPHNEPHDNIKESVIVGHGQQYLFFQVTKLLLFVLDLNKFS